MIRRALFIVWLHVPFLIGNASAQNLDCDQLKSTTVPFQFTVTMQTAKGEASGLTQIFRSDTGELSSYGKIESGPVIMTKRRGIFLLALVLPQYTINYRYTDVDIGSFNMKEPHTYHIYAARSDGKEDAGHKVEYEFVSTQELQISGCSFPLTRYRTTVYGDDSVPVSSVEGDYSLDMQASLVLHNKVFSSATPMETSTEVRSIETQFEPLTLPGKP